MTALLCGVIIKLLGRELPTLQPTWSMRSASFFSLLGIRLRCIRKQWEVCSWNKPAASCFCNWSSCTIQCGQFLEATEEMKKKRPCSCLKSFHQTVKVSVCLIIWWSQIQCMLLPKIALVWSMKFVVIQVAKTVHKIMYIRTMYVGTQPPKLCHLLSIFVATVC